MPANGIKEGDFFIFVKRNEKFMSYGYFFNERTSQTLNLPLKFFGTKKMANYAILIAESWPKSHPSKKIKSIHFLPDLFASGKDAIASFLPTSIYKGFADISTCKTDRYGSSFLIVEKGIAFDVELCAYDHEIFFPMVKNGGFSYKNGNIESIYMGN
jgi:hypothetical protein